MEPGPGEGEIKYNIYHSGVDYVPKTGPAILERGERIISKENNVRGNGSITVNLNVGGNLIGDRKIFDEFVNKIHQRLSHLQDWGYR